MRAHRDQQTTIGSKDRPYFTSSYTPKNQDITIRTLFFSLPKGYVLS